MYGEAIEYCLVPEDLLLNSALAEGAAWGPPDLPRSRGLRARLATIGSSRSVRSFGSVSDSSSEAGVHIRAYPILNRSPKGSFYDGFLRSLDRRWTAGDGRSSPLTPAPHALPAPMPLLDLADLPPDGPLLGLDPGAKTIGVAIADATRTIASPVETVHQTTVAHDAERLLALRDPRARAEMVLRHLSVAGTRAFGTLGSARPDVGIGSPHRDHHWRSLAATPLQPWHTESTPLTAMDDTTLLERRLRLIGAGSPLFYDTPLHLVRGEGVWLWDADGRRYLDGYNNVPHVGHCHPRVVKALCDQAQVLNVHTRYLHEAILDYGERLTATFAAELSMMALCCTGTEANELALRIARHATGADGIIVTACTYHGNSKRWARRPPPSPSPSRARPSSRPCLRPTATGWLRASTPMIWPPAMRARWRPPSRAWRRKHQTGRLPRRHDFLLRRPADRAAGLYGASGGACARGGRALHRR